MHRRCLRTVLLASLGVLAWISAEGQVPLPSYDFANVLEEVRTVTVWADFGWRRGEGEPLGGHIVANLGRINVRGAGGAVLGTDPGSAGFVGTGLGVDLYSRSPSAPTLTPDLGVWYSWTDRSTNTSLKQWDVPLGVGLSWYLPALVVNVEPWVKPRVHFRSRTIDNGSSTSGQNIGVGLSAGLTLTHVNGPGFHAAVDLLRIGDEITGASATEWVFTLGLHWKVFLGPRN